MKISIHRALAELKMLDKRINRAIEQPFVSYQIGEEAPRGYKSTEEFEKYAKSSFQSVNDLIDRRNKIKAAILESNAKVVVNISGKEHTVAEAIDRKDSIKYEKSLLQSLRSQLSEVLQSIDYEKEDMNERLEKRIESDLGSKDRKDHSKEVEEITNNFLKRYEPRMVDPIDIRKEIDARIIEIEDFETEVDFILSESNTSTLIEIPD